MSFKVDDNQDQALVLDGSGLESFLAAQLLVDSTPTADTQATGEETQQIKLHTGPTTGQWHLESGGGYDINVLTAWEDYTGAGVTVGVVDSGIDYNHSEFNGRYNHTIDWDYNAGNGDGGPKTSGDNHGTAVAGNIAAANDGVGNTGVAYGSTITSFRLGSGTGSTFADALSQNVDISNNSWGWGQGLTNVQSFNQTIDAGMLDAVANNRGGLGTILVFSAGNDREDGDNSNYSELTNSRFSITVAAGNENGTISYFSTPGATTLITAPGTSIYTTDRTGAPGYSGSDYATVQGTSFSAPITSGVIALMLEANSDLGYRDVQEILAYSAIQTDSGNASWEFNGARNWNGGGLHASEDFGFGFIDATAAVRLAETWFAIDDTAGTYSNEDTLTFNSGVLNANFDNSTYNNVINVGSNFNIDHVGLQLNMTHNRVSDLTIELISPDGTSSIMFDAPPAVYTENDAWQGWRTFSSTQHWGEIALGNWTLSVTDSTGGQSASLIDWSLTLYGDTFSNNNTYIYTNEFGNFTADAARKTLVDTSGIDTINASAVSSDLVLNLAAGAESTIAGNTLTIGASTSIENAIGGDGNDVILGNGLNNTLIGGRGNDTLDGGGGIDTLIGGLGDDIYYVDSLEDIVIEYENEGYDIIYSTLANYILSANVELLQIISGGANVTGSSGDDNIVGNAENNNIWGVGGNDKIYGADGDDVLYGGDGNDTLKGDGGNDGLYGDAGNDLLFGFADDDFLSGGDGADKLYGGLGNDTMYGGSGNDYLKGEDGNDTLYGDAGIDILTGNSGNDELHGGDDNDKLYGGLGADTLYGDAGNDYIKGDDGDDIIYGGNDDDILTGGRDNDTLYGEAGNDSLYGDAGDDELYGGDGADVLRGHAGLDTLVGGNGNDILKGGDDADNLDGGADDDILYGEDGNDILTGGTGNDTLDGGAGIDIMAGGLGDDTYWVDNVGDSVTENLNEGTDLVRTTLDNYTLGNNIENLYLIGSQHLTGNGNALDNTLYGNSGWNTLFGMDGNDRIYGGDGGDTLHGGNGADILYGQGGRDTLYGNDDNDTLYGGDDIDNLYGGNGDDTLRGENGDDRLYGDAGADRLYGGAGNDQLYGGNDDDLLNGEAGNDLLRGEAGNDTYLFSAGGNFGADIIRDSAGSADLLNLVVYSLSSVLSWDALDSNSDGRMDQLFMDFGTGNSITVENYFGNTLALSAGTGLLETIRFASNVYLDFDDVSALV